MKTTKIQKLWLILSLEKCLKSSSTVLDCPSLLRSRLAKKLLIKVTNMSEIRHKTYRKKKAFNNFGLNLQPQIIRLIVQVQEVRITQMLINIPVYLCTSTFWSFGFRVPNWYAFYWRSNDGICIVVSKEEGKRINSKVHKLWVLRQYRLLYIEEAKEQPRFQKKDTDFCVHQDEGTRYLWSSRKRSCNSEQPGPISSFLPTARVKYGVHTQSPRSTSDHKKSIQLNQSCSYDCGVWIK
jgi:hypothetical protein